MMRHKLFIIVILLTLLPAQLMAQTPQEQGLSIAREADRHDTGWVDQAADMKMILRTKAGEESVRMMSMQVFELDAGNKSMVRFLTPRDIRGTVLLTFSYKGKDDEQWLYLPKLKRVKRIATSSKSGPFVGSEFSYEDMIPQEIEKYTYQYIKNESCGEWDCFVVERYPTDIGSGYTRQVVWLDTIKYRVHKIDFYDRKKSLLKTLEAKNYQLYRDDFWRPEISVMTNHHSGKSTELHFTDYQFASGLNGQDFDPDRIGR